MIRGQKIGQWHRAKTYSSLVTGYFELRAERRKGGWIAYVDVADPQGDEYGDSPLTAPETDEGATREDAEMVACETARDLADELIEAARMAPERKPKPLAPFVPPEPRAVLTIAAVLDAERTLSANNVPPPYELRTMRSAMAGLRRAPV